MIYANPIGEGTPGKGSGPAGFPGHLPYHTGFPGKSALGASLVRPGLNG
ncbi:MAG: hypothetical protein OXI91_15515 [Chloroflexota bacterium]|nr:hypothetical protein [Chloroflexota bacterium]